jgi:hypothetical protein
MKEMEAKTEWDKGALAQRKTVTALVVPKKQCARTMKLFKGCSSKTGRHRNVAERDWEFITLHVNGCRIMFKMPRVRSFVDIPDVTDSKLLLLDESVQICSIPSDLDEAQQLHLKEHEIRATTHTFELKYEDLSADDVLKVCWITCFIASQACRQLSACTCTARNQEKEHQHHASSPLRCRRRDTSRRQSIFSNMFCST